MMTLRTLLLLTAALCTAHAQTTPFSRGVNLTNWFQEASPRQIQFSKYTKKDFADIKALGCDVIRLPVNLHAMTSGAPLYTPDPLFLGMLDQAVNWAEELGLHIIIDNHTFDPAVDTPVNIYTVLVPVWKQMAAHLKGRSTLVHYEVLNEPHGINEHLWNTIQKMVIDTIRSVDTKHTIIVGPANWNALSSLAGMPAYADTNLIYTFHFYDPFLFTHQGASWASPSLVPLAGMPFPYDAARMPALPDTLKGTWIQDAYNGYATAGTNAAVTATLDAAAAFRTSRKVPLLCGELGVFIPNSPDSDRVRWYDVVRKRLEQNGIAWTSWDYQGGFGLFRKDSPEMFEHDLNTPLISALGLTVPPQTPYVKRPDSVTLPLYADFAGPRIRTYFNGAYGDFYSTQGPAAGSYALRFGNAPQYEAVQFKFVPEKDLSRLLMQWGTLSMKVRSASPDLAFDVRFVDTKTGPTDRPWRMRKVITSAAAAWDGQWHTLSIPLSSFAEHGAWDNGWYNPIGAFDWTSVSHFEIVSEQASLAGKEVFFDDIYIVPFFPESVADGTAPEAFTLHQNYPNPFNPVTAIAYSVPTDGAVTLTVYDLLGREVSVLFSGFARAGEHTAVFDASHLSSGVYICRLTSGRFNAARKMVLQR